MADDTELEPSRKPRKEGRKRSKLVSMKPRCGARRTNGEPCRNFPMHGARVCRKHGGGTPQVRRKAKERLLAAVDPLMAELIRIALDRSLSPADQTRAITWALERAGFSSRDPDGGEPAPWQVLINKIVIEDSDGQVHVTSDGEKMRGRYRPPAEDYVDVEVVEDVEESVTEPVPSSAELREPPPVVNGDDHPPKRLDPEGLARPRPRKTRMKR